jgi:5-methylcytosine-specific restriction endonuclease McrA
MRIESEIEVRMKMNDPFEDLNDNWTSRWLSKKNDYFERAFPVTCKDTGETVCNYKEYLSTRHWKNLKDRFFKSKLYRSAKYYKSIGGMGGACLICSKTDELHVHHRTYKRLGREWLQDLLAICSECHGDLHRKYDELMKKDSSRSKALTLKYVHERLPKAKERMKEAKVVKRKKRRLNIIKMKQRAALQSKRAKARNKKKLEA